ncbi:MAG: polysaccharide biosynthesis tyrosine autokinase [Martelella sp.]|uniref:GumC family protein n=1 Tax=Martelella sp. TaxID=1969699 RepID=UPI0032429292
MQTIDNNSVVDEIDISKIFFVFWRHKFLIAGLFALFVIAGWYYAAKMTTPIYTASSVTMVSPQAKQVIDLPSVVGQIGTDNIALRSEIEVIKSRVLIGKVVDILDLTADPEFNYALRQPGELTRLKAYIKGMIFGTRQSSSPAPVIDLDRTRDRVVSALLSRFTADVVPSTTTFRITVNSEVPEKAALIADTIAEQYVQRQVEIERTATTDAISWLSSQVAELKLALDKSENAVKQFKSDTPLTTIEVLSGLERQLKSIRDRISEARQKVADESSLVAALDQASGYRQKAILMGDPTLIDLAEAASTDARSARLFDSRLEMLQTERTKSATQAASQLAALETAETSLKQKIQTESDAYSQLEQLVREVEANTTLYEYFLTRLKETSAQQGIQQSGNVVLSYAVVPSGASKPNVNRSMMISGALGLLLGCGLSLLLEMRHNTFRTSQELEEHSGIHVLGSLPLVAVKFRDDIFQYLREHSTSPFAEAIRNLRTSILLANIDNPPQVIMLSSSIPGEGKTTSSIGLALNFVGMGKRVLLVEGDLRRLTFHRYFKDAQATAGLISVLAGNTRLEQATFHHEELGLDILFGERSTKNAADVLSSRRMEELLDEARTAYDFIIVDAPPVLIVPDPRVLSQFVDTILFIVKWDSTHQNQVEEALRSFDRSKIGGLVLSQIDPSGFKRYGYNYGFGYGYAAYEGEKYYE